MTTWAEALESFAQNLPGFQRRVNQDNLALKIESSLEAGIHLFAQAGCGTGKSFAGAIPAIRKSKETGLPTIIATATKALQDQLANKDLPFLQDTIGDFTFAVLKGRSNYVCLQKVDELENKSFSASVLTATETEGFTGEIESLPIQITPQEKASLSTTSDECPGKNDCPFGKVCFAELAKAKAKESNLVIVNHAVLAADLAVKANQRSIGIPEEKVTGLLPRFGGVIVDEAHEMADFVTNALGGEITAGSFSRLASEVHNVLGDRDAIKSVTAANDDLFREVEALLFSRDDKRSSTVSIDSAQLAKLAPKLTVLYEALGKLQVKVENFEIRGDDKGLQKKRRLLKRINNASTKVFALVILDSDSLVRWLELGEGKKGSTINWAPLSVAEFLREELLSQAPVTFMSATLGLEKGETPLADQLGVDDYEVFDAGTPFNFRTQARTFIPQIAVPAGGTVNQWRSASIATITELVRASNGRALLLFTSKTELEEAHRAIAPLVVKMGHKALKQGEAPNKQLAQEFASDEHSVLFALKSFFTGVDIQGDSLRLVVINKMPFPVPSDVVFKARTDSLDRKNGQWKPKGGFYGLTVPTMALSLMQAYGRLIRTVEDQGMVAILDSRLYGDNAKAYGKKIMESLPEAPVLTKLDDAIEYLESLEVSV